MADQKTEQPTQHRLQKSRREGQFATSRDLLSTIQFAAGLVLLFTSGHLLIESLASTVSALMRRAFASNELTALGLQRILGLILSGPMLLIGEGGAALMGLVLLVQLASTGFGLALKSLSPNFSKLNVTSRITRLPVENLSATLRALVLLPLFAWLLYREISARLEELSNLSVTSLASGLTQTTQMLTHLLIRVTSVLIVFGLIDYFRQRRQHTKRLKMSKQEVRDESKEMEGNPQMKMRIRRIQRERFRRRMLAAVPRATAVIVNPTHYAVALFYELNTRTVPKVVAKGQNYLAKLIREKAEQNGVPVIENVELAQALYKATEVGQEIPSNLYRAVAEVLAYIYRTMNRGGAG
jgi:flagellar biosynthetic protein FlhB